MAVNRPVSQAGGYTPKPAEPKRAFLQPWEDLLFIEKSVHTHSYYQITCFSLEPGALRAKFLYTCLTSMLPLPPPRGTDHARTTALLGVPNYIVFHDSVASYILSALSPSSVTSHPTQVNLSITV